VATTAGKTESEIQDEFKNRRMLYWLLIAAVFVLMFTYTRVAPVGEHSTTAVDLICGAGLAFLLVALWTVFRCPNCRASLPKTFSAGFRRNFFCPNCGVKLAG
jgi:predicted RNA-binding Zn-ribbon protein involved in translation (DUF1610 family)